jgi:hypothetical protein
VHLIGSDMMPLEHSSRQAQVVEGGTHTWLGHNLQAAGHCNGPCGSEALKNGSFLAVPVLGRCCLQLISTCFALSSQSTLADPF